jgi:raffinose/stachyose/melibiose transport system substrate-binding protein
MRLSGLALAAVSAFALMGGTALAQDKTFNIWWFEGADSAQGITWTKALEELKAAHPDVTVNFEQ